MGVIELRPQITVTPQEPLYRNEAFSVPFRVENTGYFSFPVEHTSFFVNRVTRGSLKMESNAYGAGEWDHYILDRGEGKTVMTIIRIGIPDKADIAVAIDYRWCRLCPITRRLFRFVGARGEKWQWQKQPSREIADEANKQIDGLIKAINKDWE